MTEYSKFNIIYRLQRWLDSVPGQTFLNYAYSWGASIVILGTLFKLTHLPGANIMLYFGMGTEVIVFFISAFDRPFDKTAIGKDIPTHVSDDDYEGEEMPSAYDGGMPQEVTAIPAGSNGQGGVAPSQPMRFVDGGASSDDVATVASAAFTSPVAQPASPEMEEATMNYIDELKRLTETLAKVSEQSERLTRDSEEMENLNRTLTGICKVYEMQLKGASSQIGTIDEINEQSRRMAQQIEQLNRIYTRMIEAMTVNMRNVGNNGTNAEV